MKIGIFGCAGRMGVMTAQHVFKTSGFELIGGTVRPGSPHEGADLNDVCCINSPSALTLTSDIAKIAQDADVLIDFTRPEALEKHLQIAAETKTPIVVCSTGLASQHQEALLQHSREIPIVYAPNTSTGVAVLTAAVDFIARTLDASYDIEIFEMHHRNKQDAPSGTAIALGQCAGQARGMTLKAEECVIRTGKRQEGEIGFSAARGGGVCGDVKAMFVDDSEMLELSHRALNRALFAKGALKAAAWVCNAKPGLYAMKDVLGIGTLN